MAIDIICASSDGRDSRRIWTWNAVVDIDCGLDWRNDLESLNVRLKNVASFHASLFLSNLQRVCVLRFFPILRRHDKFSEL